MEGIFWKLDSWISIDFMMRELAEIFMYILIVIKNYK